jgi:putative endonuclease
MYYLYILRCLKNGKLYIGSSPDVKDRFRSLNAGENKATKPNIPYEHIFYSGFISKKDAISSEQYFKTTAGWKRIHKMLENTLDKI